MDKQKDLFIENGLCECTRTSIYHSSPITHAITEYEIKEAISRLNRIKKLILDHGWDLTKSYYYYLDKLGSCSARTLETGLYLIEVRKKLITIPLNREGS